MALLLFRGSTSRRFRFPEHPRQLPHASVVLKRRLAREVVAVTIKDGGDTARREDVTEIEGGGGDHER